MMFDFDLKESPLPAHADVCILGAGAAGVALAIELSAAGKSVVLLEGGGPELEKRSQDIYRSELGLRFHRGIHEGRFRTLGGSTTRWGGQILELQPEDFEQREWVEGSGWPFAKTELTGFYERSLHFAGLGDVPHDDRDVWKSLDTSPLDLGTEFSMMFSRWLPERNMAQLHRQALEQRANLKIYCHANAIGFEMNAAGDAIEAVQVRGFFGRTARMTAGVFVVCLGGIESTRLLLQPAAEGIMPWQKNGLLGRFYQDHIGMNGVRVRLRVAKPWRYFGFQMAKAFRFHTKIWMRPEEQQRLGTLNVAGTIGPEACENRERDEAMRQIRELAQKRRLPGVAQALRLMPHAVAIALERIMDRMRGEGPKWKHAMLAVHAEQSPHGTNRITLSDERDELGLLRSRLLWDVNDAEVHTLRSYVRLASEVFPRQGIGDVEPPTNFYEDDDVVRGMCADSYHHMGGTVMATSADAGVVDANLRLHGVCNGYVCSSSVFPSSGYSNPTHTLMALAMRLADLLTSS